MTAPPCDLCSMKSLQAALLEPLWPMPSSTVNATTGTSANRLARRVSFRLNEASRAGRFTECARKCAPLSRPNAIGNAYMSRRSSAQSNANSRPKHRAVRSLPSANKLSCSAWPTISTNSGHFILDFHFMPELFNSARWVLLFPRRITEVFYSCFTGKFFAKAAPRRKLAGDQSPIRVRGAQCSFSKNAIA